MTMRLARAQLRHGVMFSSFMPRSSEMTSPPVRMAMSLQHGSLRRSPKPGALTAAHLEHTTQAVDHQGRQSFALHVFSDDEQGLRLPLRDLLSSTGTQVTSSRLIFLSKIKM